MVEKPIWNKLATPPPEGQYLCVIDGKVCLAWLVNDDGEPQWDVDFQGEAYGGVLKYEAVEKWMPAPKP